MKRINIKKMGLLFAIILTFSVFTACAKVDTGDEYDHRADIKVTNVTFEAPEGMEYDEERGNASIEKEDMAVYFNYWKSTERDDYRYFDDFDEELCRGFENESLKEFYGKEIDFEITRFNRFEIDGLLRI